MAEEGPLGLAFAQFGDEKPAELESVKKGHAAAKAAKVAGRCTRIQPLISGAKLSVTGRCQGCL